MSYLQLGDYIEKENLSLEHKEFCLKNVDEHQLCNNFDDIFTNHTLKLCNQTLMHYSKYVIPKYVSAFTHLKGTNKKGIIYIGVDDMGQITGIPYLKTTKEFNIPKNKIIDNITENIRIIKDGKVLSSLKKKEYLKKRLKVSKIECVCNPSHLNDDYQQYHDSLMTKKEYITKQLNDYHIHKQLWHQNIRQYTMKMSILANAENYRKQTIIYIKQNCKVTELRRKHITRLNDSKPLIVPKTKIFRKLRNNPNSVFYWIVSWKDHMIEKLSVHKPKHPILPALPYHLHFLRKRLTLHRKRWIINTPNIGYYVLKIQICRSTKYNIEYYDKKQKKWMSVTRKNNSKIGPYCDLL